LKSYILKQFFVKFLKESGQLIYTKRLAKNIDLTINYEGRKTGISPLINVGRAQVKATF